MANYDTSPKPGETLAQTYKRLAKVADQRLVRLERLSQTAGFENVLNYAYASARHDITALAGENAKRFNVQIPKTDVNGKPLSQKLMDKRYMAAINSVSKFINSVTSTKGGIIATYKKRADTFNEKYGTNFTWKDLANYFESGAFDKNREKYGSDQALYLIGALTEPVDDVKDDIFEAVSKYEKVPFEEEEYYINKELSKLSNKDKKDYEERSTKYSKIKNSAKQLEEINKYLNRAKNNAAKNRLVEAQKKKQEAKKKGKK